MSVQSKLTKRERRRLRREGVEDLNPRNKQKQTFKIKNIQPITANQEVVFEEWNDGQNLLLHGVAGTGKTFLGFYLGLTEVLEGDSPYNSVTIVRSAVPTRDMGFLPGNLKEKSRAYELPYYAIATELYGRGDAYEILKNRNDVEFITTSHVRGVTLNNTIVVVDEIQNLTFHELDSIITRCGKNCKIIMCGDFRQNDLADQGEASGITQFMKIIKKMSMFSFVEFNNDDIVRSKLVKEYIILKEKTNGSRI
jgi:phosphate starvation-inducible PhoH-like protein